MKTPSPSPKMRDEEQKVRIQDHYDCIILGHHPSALLCAALVGRLGLSVLILPFVSGKTLLVSRQGQYLDPETNYLLGLGRSNRQDGLLLSCFNHLKLTDSEMGWIQFESSHIQVLTPETRLVLGSHEHGADEFNREFGKHLAKQVGLIGALKIAESECLSYWQGFPQRLTLTNHKKSSLAEPKNLRELRRKLSRVAISSGESAIMPWMSSRLSVSRYCQMLEESELSQVFQGLWYSVIGSADEDPMLFDLLHALSLSKTGAQFRGGMKSYRELLLEIAKRNGVHIAQKLECKRIFIDRGKFSGVQVIGRGNVVSGSFGVLGCSLERALQKVTYTGASWLVRPKKSKPPTGWKFTLSLDVSQEAIPKEMKSRSVWQEHGAPPMEIEVVDSITYGLNDPGMKILYLRCLMPFSSESLKPDFQRRVAGRMIRLAIDLMPFLENHVRRVFPDVRFKDSPDSQIYGFPSLEEVPDNLKVYSGKGLGFLSGLQGLFLTSDESYPELGSLGSTTAALEVATRVANANGLAGPLV